MNKTVKVIEFSIFSKLLVIGVVMKRKRSRLTSGFSLGLHGWCHLQRQGIQTAQQASEIKISLILKIEL